MLNLDNKVVDLLDNDVPQNRREGIWAGYVKPVLVRLVLPVYVYRLFRGVFRWKRVHTLCSLLPIRKRTIFFESHRGVNYSCNPKYIYEYIREKHPEFNCIWSFQNLNLKSGLPDKQVKRFSLRYYYLLATSKYLVHNAEFGQNLPVRSGQFFLNTQHGTPLKLMGIDWPSASKSITSSKYTKQGRWSAITVQNDYSAEVFTRVFRFDGPVISTGYPRNDMFYRKDFAEYSKDLKLRLDLQGKKIILYAPTWRDKKGQLTDSDFELKIDLESFQVRFGSNSVLLLRMHHLISSKLSIPQSIQGAIIDVSSPEHDIQELCAISDILITDYSSVMFDFANLKRPMIYYCYDYDEYVNTSRGVYFDMKTELPGPVVETEDALFLALEYMGMQKAIYADKYSAFKEKFCCFDDGAASERVTESMLFGEMADFHVKSQPTIKDRLRSIAFLPRTGERIGVKTNYSLVLRYPFIYPFLKGNYFGDESQRFQSMMAGLAKKKYKRVLILGNAPCLNDLNEADFNELFGVDCLTIGLNRSIYKFQTDVLLWSDLLTIKDIAESSAVSQPKCNVVHVRLERDHRLPAAEDKDFQYLHQYWTEHQNFSVWPKNKLYMFRNILVPALDMVYRLGINDITLVGFDFDDRDYFYESKLMKPDTAYEIRSDKQIEENCGGYDTKTIIKEVLEYLIDEEKHSIKYNGSSDFLKSINGLENISFERSV